MWILEDINNDETVDECLDGLNKIKKRDFYVSLFLLHTF